MTTTHVDTARIRPGRLNFEVTEGDAWTHKIALSRAGARIDLTSAIITTRFRSDASNEVTELVYAAADLQQGEISVGQAAGESGAYAISVTEEGATARVMLKGDITAERVL